METQITYDLVMLLCKLLFALFSTFVLCLAWYFREFKKSIKDEFIQLRKDMEKGLDQNRKSHKDLYGKIWDKRSRRNK
jgi:hypothetical protein